MSVPQIISDEMHLYFERSGNMSCALGIFGTFASIVVALQIARRLFPWIYENILGPKLGHGVNLKKFGKWAVVTGATDGIGKEYARTLAKNGINIVLISRTLSKLETVAKEIEGDFGVETKVIDVDFKGGAEIYQKIEKGLQGLEIGILVNNVGISYAVPEYYLTLPNPDQTLHDLVNVNIYSVLNMTQLVLPKMVERGSGAIINISSLSAVIPAPLLTVYAAAKAFVDKFSDDLQTEYKSKGIIVQSIVPGFVSTNMSKIRKPTLIAPSAKTYVESAISTLGVAQRSAGYLPHAIMELAIDLMNFFSPTFARATTLKQMESIRKRAMKKANSSKSN